MKLNYSLIPKDAVVAVALSGGRDSMALLHSLLKKGYTVKAICVEHGIRGEVSKDEAKSVYNYCKKIGVECKLYTVDSLAFAEERKLTVEQSARELRYQCFESAVKDGFCDIIATAHHADDNVETLLMRILRGTGTKGLCGIAKKRGIFVRPMLEVTREEIDEYVKREDIKYFEDETNEDTTYTRNYIRHEIIPILKSRYPALNKSFSRLSETAREDEMFFAQYTKDKLIDLCGAWGIKCEDLIKPAIGSRLIRLAFSKLGVTVDVEERHVDIVKALIDEENGTSVDMPYGVVCSKEYDLVTVYKKRERNLQEVPLNSANETYTVKDIKVKVSQVEKREAGGVYLDYDKAYGAVFRTKRQGDVFKRFGGGTKSLGDYFTDIKLPVRLRDSVVVLARGSEVLAVVGIEISDKVKIDDNTQRIIKIEEVR